MFWHNMSHIKTRDDLVEWCQSTKKNWAIEEDNLSGLTRVNIGSEVFIGYPLTDGWNIFLTKCKEHFDKWGFGSCYHNMVEYQGFNESYKFCTKCDRKELF